MYIVTHGVPRKIHIDQGTKFKSNDIKALCRRGRNNKIASQFPDANTVLRYLPNNILAISRMAKSKKKREICLLSSNDNAVQDLPHPADTNWGVCLDLVTSKKAVTTHGNLQRDHNATSRINRRSA